MIKRSFNLSYLICSNMFNFLIAVFGSVVLLFEVAAPTASGQAHVRFLHYFVTHRRMILLTSCNCQSIFSAILSFGEAGHCICTFRMSSDSISYYYLVAIPDVFATGIQKILKSLCIFVT
jgi:hypothetical protein